MPLVFRYLRFEFSKNATEEGTEVATGSSSSSNSNNASLGLNELAVFTGLANSANSKEDAALP